MTILARRMVMSAAISTSGCIGNFSGLSFQNKDQIVDLSLFDISGIVRGDLCHTDWFCRRQSLLSCMTNWHFPREFLSPYTTKLALFGGISITLYNKIGVI